jgi:hypothetical protein
MARKTPERDDLTNDSVCTTSDVILSEDGERSDSESSANEPPNRSGILDSTVERKPRRQPQHETSGETVVPSLAPIASETR